MLEMEIKRIEEINQNKTKDIDSIIEKYLVKLRSQCLSEDEMKHMQTLNKEKRDLESKLKEETDQITVY